MAATMRASVCCHSDIRNVFIINVGLYLGAAEIPVIVMQMSGCTRVQPYKRLHFNRVKQLAHPAFGVIRYIPF